MSICRLNWPSVRRRRILQAVGAIVALAIVFSATWVAVAVHIVFPRSSAADLATTLVGSENSSDAIAGKLRHNERVNLLLLARGGSGDDNPDYTDTTLVLSFRLQAHRATAITMPRYLWVDIPAPVVGNVQGKLYSAYALGASQDAGFIRPAWRTPTGQGDLAAATVSLTIAQPIDAWISVDLKAFAAIVDAIGGIRISIATPLDDSKYPSDVGEQRMHIHFDAGPQILDGRRALQYARSRMSTSEGDRARRQELVLMAMLSQLKHAGLSPSLLAAAGPLKDGLRTNLTIADARTLGAALSAIRAEDVTSITLEDSPLLTVKTLEGDQDVLVPKDQTYRELRAYLAERLP
jgi:LCP family protein required for cell wall assembly